MDTKVFTKWYHDDYMFGNAGDYLVVRDDANNDAYIVKKEIMAKTYELLD
jgi:phage anti-repressor protein